MKKLVFKLLILVFLIFNIVSYSVLINHDYKVAQIIRLENRDMALLDKVLSGLSYYDPAEMILVKKYQEQVLSCESLKLYSDRLLEMNYRSSQAYFLKTVCAEIEGNLESALDYTKKSLRYDKFNTVYLLNLAILQLNLGDVQSSQETLDKISNLDPNLRNLQVVQEALNNRIEVVK